MLKGSGQWMMMVMMMIMLLDDAFVEHPDRAGVTLEPPRPIIPISCQIPSPSIFSVKCDNSLHRSSLVAEIPRQQGRPRHRIR